MCVILYRFLVWAFILLRATCSSVDAWASNSAETSPDVTALLQGKVRIDGNTALPVVGELQKDHAVESKSAKSGTSIIFVSMVRNCASSIHQTIKSLKSYVDDMKVQPWGHGQNRVQVFFYAGDSYDGTSNILAQAFRGLTEYSSESAVVEHAEVIPETYDTPHWDVLKNPMWPQANGSFCPFNRRNCHIAYLREKVRSYVLKSITSGKASPLDLAGAVVVIFDGDVWQLPTVPILRKAVSTVAQRQLDVVFSNGRQSPGPKSFYYDSFASVSANGTFQIPSVEHPLPAHVEPVLKMRSGFGGLAVYSADAYWQADCSYTNQQHSGDLSQYIKTDEKDVKGWPCEHTTLNLCLFRKNFDLAMFTDLIVIRTDGQHYQGEAHKVRRMPDR
mmetsp:Transcript_25021/g.45522  ORF Transcript_25021/g.45522 Transcript_25021/m.45522 type:complete len:389 (+) Transcript_25021:70-1236(+)